MTTDDKYVVFPDIRYLWETDPKLYGALLKLYRHFGAEHDGDAKPYAMIINRLCSEMKEHGQISEREHYQRLLAMRDKINEILSKEYENAQENIRMD